MVQPMQLICCLAQQTSRSHGDLSVVMELVWLSVSKRVQMSAALTVSLQML
jgi:hypothetical protein